MVRPIRSALARVGTFLLHRKFQLLFLHRLSIMLMSNIVQIVAMYCMHRSEEIRKLILDNFSAISTRLQFLTALNIRKIYPALIFVF